MPNSRRPARAAQAQYQLFPVPGNIHAAGTALLCELFKGITKELTEAHRPLERMVFDEQCDFAALASIQAAVRKAIWMADCGMSRSCKTSAFTIDASDATPVDPEVRRLRIASEWALTDVGGYQGGRHVQM